MPFAVLVFILCCGIMNTTFAQPEIAGVRLYHGQSTTFEQFHDIYALANNGFVLCGSSDNWWVLRTNANLDPVWSRFYNGSVAKSIIETDAGGFLSGGTNNGFTAILTDANGEVEWEATYINGSCEAVIELKNGNFAMADYTGNMLGEVALVEGNGNPIWLRTYRMWDGCRDCYFTALRESDGGIVVIGNGRAPDRVRLCWVMKIDFEGEVVWNDSIRLGENIYSIPTTMVSSPDNGFLLGGRSINPAENYVPFILKINNQGQFQWSRRFFIDEAFTDMGWTLARNQNEGYAFAGSRFFDGQTRQGLVYRLNLNGEVIWQRVLEFDQDERFMPYRNELFGIIYSNDGALLAAGTVNNRVQERGQDGVIVAIEPEFDGPMVTYFSPEDTTITIVPVDSIRFILSARNQINAIMDYRWFYNDSLYSLDTTNVVIFDSLDLIDITGQVILDNSIATIVWHVTVTDLYISHYSPDSLNLTLRRGQSVNF